MSSDGEVASTDRVMDWALQEAIGARQPPDLRARVRARVRSERAPALAAAAVADAEVTYHEPAERFSWRAAAWIAAGLTVAVATALLSDRSAPEHGAGAAQGADSRAAQEVAWTTVTSVEELARVDAACRALRVQGTAPDVVAGLARLAQLERLDLTRGTSELDVLDEAALAAVGARATLRELRLDLRIEIEAAWLQALANLPLLETLTLAHVQVGDAGIATLAKLPSLRRLELVFDRTLTDRGLGFLATIPTLRGLALRGCGGLTAAGLVELGKLRQLESLDLTVTNGTGAGPGPQLSPRTLGQVTAMLEAEMTLSAKPGGGVTDEVLEALGRLENLRVLRLGGCPSVTARGIAALAKVPLRALHLFSKTDPMLDSVRALPPTLEELSLAWSRSLSEAALQELPKRVPKLRRLDLAQCTGITNRGLRAVLDGCALEGLNLRGCRGLTGASLGPLLAETSLTALDVSGLAWVDEDSEAALRALPALRHFENRRAGGMLMPK